MELDLGSFASIHRFASNWNRQWPQGSGHKGEGALRPLHVLVLNAGVICKTFESTSDGLEATFGVNYLGHFYLQQLLTGALMAVQGEPSRVISVTSNGHWLFHSRTVPLDAASVPRVAANFSMFGAYGEAKLANILHMRQLAVLQVCR